MLKGALHLSDYVTKVMKRLSDQGMFPKVVLESCDQGMFPKVRSGFAGSLQLALASASLQLALAGVASLQELIPCVLPMVSSVTSSPALRSAPRTACFLVP